MNQKQLAERDYRHRLVACCLRLAEGTDLEPTTRERELLVLFEMGRLTIEQVIEKLEPEAK